MPTRLVILRHGETEWSASGRHTGRSDIPLTAAGRSQAATVPDRLAALDFGLVSTSPSMRAVDDAVHFEDEWCSHAVFPE